MCISPIENSVSLELPCCSNCPFNFVHNPRFSPSTPYRIAQCTSSVSPEFVDARPTGADFSKFCFHPPFSQQRNDEVDECAQFQRQSALPVIDEMKRARLGLEFLQDDT